MTTHLPLKLLFIGLFLIALPLFVQAQEKGFVETKNAKESLKFAQQYYAQGDLQKARRQLEHTIKIKKNFAIAHRILGKVYFDLQDYPAAIEAYELSFDLDDKVSRGAFFECAEAYLLEENISVANYYFNKYKEMKDKSYANADKEKGLEREYDDRLPIREQNLLFINQLDSSSVDIPITNLGATINSKEDEYLPSITSDGDFLLYTRNKKNDNENIFLSINKDGEWASAMQVNGDLNTGNNEGMAKFETHGNTFYFCGCKRESENSGCDIYKAEFEHGRVNNIKPIEGRLNSHFWDSQPSVSCDGNMLFFTSTREGGYGGSDLWMSKKLPNGEWGIPENLGPKVNTPMDEEAPFIATDGVTLYFTSNGHPGMGNGDIFISYLEKDGWSIPDNLGYPINSPAKELGIYIQGDCKTTYFASARKGGTGGMDIYKFEIPSLYQPWQMVQLEGLVIDRATRKPIEATIKFGNNGNHWEVSTNKRGWFFQCFAESKGYSIQIHKEGYEPYIDAIYLEPQNNLSNQELLITLVPKAGNNKAVATSTEPIDYSGEERLTKTIIQLYFDYDSSQITEKHNQKLDKLADLINRYDDWNIEVVGFADNVGNIDYNRKLSKQRADEVVRFLKTKSNLGIVTNISDINQTTNEGQEDKTSRLQSRRVDVILER